jgi:hypothetical protein
VLITWMSSAFIARE